MGYFGEEYFDVSECPKCKGKKFRAVVTSRNIFYNDEGEVWEDELSYDIVDIEVFCDKCGEKV